VLLPGLPPADEITVFHEAGADTADAFCALTLEDTASVDLDAQLADLVAPHTGDDAELQSLADAARKRGLPRSVTLAACGHRFCALPFLLHVVSTRFVCPVCRGGSGQTVGLPRSCPRLGPATWALLAALARKVRAARREEQEAEDRADALSASLVSWGDVSVHEVLADVLQFFVVLQVRNGARLVDMALLPLNHFPFPDAPNVLAASDAMPITVTQGAYPVPRAVSSILRSCSWFSFKLAVYVQGALVELFESNAVQYPTDSTGVHSYVVGPAGEHLDMHYDAVPAGDGTTLRRIEYHATVSTLRPLLWDVVAL